MLNIVLTCCCSRGGFSGWEDEAGSPGPAARWRCDSGPCLIVMWYFESRLLLLLSSTGSSRKSVKSKSRSRGVYFHKKSIFAAVPSRKIATNYSSTASRSFKILFRLPSKVAPPTCLQALARCLRCLADFTTSSWSKLSAKLSTTLFSSVNHITWHFPGRDHKMLLEVSFQHRNVFHSPILQDKPSFLFRSEGGISPLPPVGRCHPVNLKTDLVEVEDKFVAISYPKTPQRIHFL